MNYQNDINTIMSKKIISLHPKDKIAQAKEIFDTFAIHHIPIVVMNKIVGIVSLGDILFLTKKPIMHSFDKYIRDKKLSIDAIEEIMTENVICMQSTDTIKDVVDVMIKNRINAIPILNKEELVGLVTSYDILKTIK